MKIRALIVDDEPPARRGLRKLLEEDRTVDVLGECEDGEKAVAMIKELGPDVVFLDIQIPGKNGFEVLHALEGKIPQVVFVTAFNQYAIDAFAVNAIDYLLKPIKRNRLKESLLRVKERLLEEQSDDWKNKLEAFLEDYKKLQVSAGKVKREEPSAGGTRSRKIFLKGKKKFYAIKAEEIDWIEAANDYMKIHIGDKVHLVRETMKNIEASLDPNIFVRIHRSKIVNIEKVVSIEPHFSGNYIIYFLDGTKILSSRLYTKNIRQKLGMKVMQ